MNIFSALLSFIPFIWSKGIHLHPILFKTVPLFQIKRKEMDSAKKSPDLPTLTPVQLMEAPLAEKTYSAPKLQAPSAKPLPSTPTLVDPAPQFRYTAPIESKINASDVIGQVLSEKVCLSVKELLALSPEVRRHFKEATTMKRLPAFPTEAHSKAAHHVTTFSMDKHHKHFSAEPALPLWTIEVTLDHTVTVTGIIDSGFQVIIICKDIWERLGMPMKHEQVMFMELANGQSNVTMGMIPNICFSIGEVSLHCQVQVIKEAPFECLLGLPFMCLASTKCQEFLDGSTHLLLMDVKNGFSDLTKEQIGRDQQ